MTGKNCTSAAKTTRITATRAIWAAGVATGVATLACAPAQAAVTVMANYRLGEIDPGASAGSAIVTSADSTGGDTATSAGPSTANVTYSADVSPAAFAATGSTLSGSFPGGSSGNNNGKTLRTAFTPMAATDNFGMEGWFKLTSDVVGVEPVYLGNTGGGGTGGYGFIIQTNHTWSILQGGLRLQDSGVATKLNEWVYMAIVRDAGVTSMYFDSVTPTVVTSPNAGAISPSTALNIGGNQGSNEAFPGLIDEVRLFTFQPGAFNAGTDLLYASVPEPTSLGLLGLGAIGMLARRRRSA